MESLLSIIYLAVLVLSIVGLWKVFVKAGRPGWAAIIPIYNLIVLLEIAGKELWWIILFFIPIANLVASILVGIEIAKRFGKSEAFGVGLALLGFVFYPILGLGEAKYQGAAGIASGPTSFGSPPSPPADAPPPPTTPSQ